MYERELVLVKIGGSLIPKYGNLDGESLERLGADLSGEYEDNNLVIVHGGANRVSHRMRELGKEPEFITSIKGFRSRRTDKKTIEIFVEVMGEINDGLVTSLRGYGLKPVGLYGKNSPLRASRKRPIAVVDGKNVRIKGDYTGRIKSIDTDSLRLYIQDGRVPIVSPIAIGDENEFLNVDGDTAAAYVAGSLNAERLVDFTDVDGVLSDGRVIPTINYDELDEWIGRVEGGMRRKLIAAKKAIEMGVNEFIIANGIKESPLTRALNHEGCTIIQ